MTPQGGKNMMSNGDDRRKDNQSDWHANFLISCLLKSVGMVTNQLSSCHAES